MSDLRFDPSKAVTFDLTRGLVHVEGAPGPTPGVLVPAEALLALAGAAGAEPAGAFARRLGEAMGRRVAVRLSGAGFVVSQIPLPGAPLKPGETVTLSLSESAPSVARAGVAREETSSTPYRP